jgi:creatinine amidohydrolase/Fe(II)-dependent formamide hydrolase-like protein
MIFQQDSARRARLSNLSLSEIETYLSTNQSIIIPLGGLEPFGVSGAIGIPGMCSDALAVEIAVTCNSLTAPLLPFASSPLFRSFPGCVSLGSSGYENVLSYLCRGFLYQGFKRVLLLHSALMPDDTLTGVLKRMEHYKNDGIIKLYSWKKDMRIIEFLKKESAASELERQETGLLSLAAFIEPQSPGSSVFSGASGDIKQAQYRTWRKRGADPEKFKKLFPTGLTSKKDTVQPSSDLGNRLFQYILNCMISDYSDFLKPDSVDVSK